MKSITSLNSPLEGALVYAGRFGWHIFPMSPQKRPLTPHGRTDATTDPAMIKEWFTRWPGAQVALATGAESGIVAIDVDLRADVDGRDALDELGVCLHPETPTAHTPSAGFHLLFRHPGGYVKSVTGKLGAGLDIRGDGGSINLPPAPGRSWDPHLNPDTIALAEFPLWARIPEPKQEPILSPQRIEQRLSRYAEAALNGAADAIYTAPAGMQEAILNRESYSLGQLVGGGIIPAGAAEDVLRAAGRRLPSHDPRRPWTAKKIDSKIRNGLLAGMREPRRPENGR